MEMVSNYVDLGYWGCKGAWMEFYIRSIKILYKINQR